MTPTSDHRVWQGNPALASFLVPIDDLHEDPGNARRHPEANLRAIAASLARFGQQTPIVHDAGRVVRKGNGTLAVARRLGWTHVAALPSDLGNVDLTAYEIADNRAGELATWDDTELALLLETIRSDPEFPLESTGFSDPEIDALLDRLADATIAGTDLEEPDSSHADSAAADEPASPRIYPLAILLNRAELRRWQGRKAELDLTDDTEAFLHVSGL